MHLITSKYGSYINALLTIVHCVHYTCTYSKVGSILLLHQMLVIRRLPQHLGVIITMWRHNRYHIAGNFTWIKIFCRFSPLISWAIFLSVDFVSRVDFVEPVNIYCTILVKIYSHYFAMQCNGSWAGQFCPVKIFSYTVYCRQRCL